MSSPGQIVGGLVGAAVGFFVPALGPILGAQLGLMVGGAIDPPKGPSITGPRIDDLSVQTATYGAPLPRGYGTVCVTGNIFWLENDQIKEWTTTEEQGGKGGGGSEVTSYSYTSTHAVGLLNVPDGDTVSLRRMWLDTDLVFDAGSDNVESIIASQIATGGTFTFYDGSDDQLPNARMQADKGAANVSAYPGLCYVVFEDLSLEKYSNTLMRAQVKCELVVSATITPDEAVCNTFKTPDPVYNYSPEAIIFGQSGMTMLSLVYDVFDTDLLQLNLQTIEYGVDAVTVSSTGFDDAYHDGSLQSKLIQVVEQTDVLQRTVFLYRTNGFYFYRRLLVFNASAQVVGDSGEILTTYLGFSPTKVMIDRGEYFFIYSGNVMLKWTGLATFATTASVYDAKRGGVSENYVFLVQLSVSSPTSCTVYRFNRSDLSLDLTYIQPVSGTYAHIDVHADDLFYSMASNGVIYEWIDGVARQTNLIYTGGGDADILRFKVFSPSLAYVWRQSYPPEMVAVYAKVPADPCLLREIVTDECSLVGIAAGDIDLDELTNSSVRGFRIAQRGTVRNTLEPLQAAYPFDVAQAGYKIRLVTRGGASVAAIPSDDLGATDGEIGILLPVSREMDSQLPFRVSLRYTDPDREYDVGEQSVTRDEKDSLNERVMELPLSLTSAEAIKMADVLLAKEWTERVDFGPFTLPPIWRHLEAADIVTVSHRGQDHTLRLTRVEYLPDGRVVCSAKLTAAASYTSSATAQSPLVVGQSLVALAGSTQGYLLDIPRIRSEQDVAGMSYGLLGLATGWPGGSLVRSDDQGNSYQAVGAVNARAKVFTADAALSSHHGFSIDHGAVLTVTPRYSGHTLSSVTEDQFYAHNNLAAYGFDGRWEIVAFKTVIDNTGSYTVKDFLRGLYGSEQYTGTHAAGDYFIVLDVATIAFFGLPTNAIGSPRLYRAVTQGYGIDSASEMTDTYDAANLKPLSAVDLNGSRTPSTLDWTLIWARRTRAAVEVFSGATVPIGETSEQYEVDIYDSSWAAVKRTISGLTSASCTYTYAQQVADFGSERITLYVEVFQLSSVVGRGYPLRQSISRTIVIDPYFDSVMSLLHFDGTGTSIADELGNTWVAQGNATQSATNKLFGTASLALDGVTDYITSTFSADPLNGAGDFTIEWWERPQDQGNRGRFTVRNTAISGTGSIAGVAVGWDGVYWQAYGGGSSHQMGGTGNANPLNTWTHMALERYSGTVNLFKAGNKLGTGYTDATNYSTNVYVAVGVYYSNAYTLLGDMEEFRITKRARYQGANFTPPSLPFPNS